MSDWIQQTAWNLVVGQMRWLASECFHAIGWGGLIGLLAGAVLLLSLSAKAVTFMMSGRGITLTAIVLVICLCLFFGGTEGGSPTRRSGGGAEPATGIPALASREAPAQSPAVAVEEAGAETEAVQAAPTRRKQTLDGPMWFDDTPWAPAMPMLSPTTHHLPPVRVLSSHPLPPKAASASHPTAHMTAAPGAVSHQPLHPPAAQQLAGRPGPATVPLGQKPAATGSKLAAAGPPPAAPNRPAPPPHYASSVAAAPSPAVHRPLSRRHGSGGHSGGQMTFGQGFMPNAAHLAAQQGHYGQAGAMHQEMTRQQMLRQQNLMAEHMMNQMMGGAMHDMGIHPGMHPMGVHPGAQHPGGMEHMGMGGGHAGGMRHPGGHH